MYIRNIYVWVFVETVTVQWTSTCKLFLLSEAFSVNFYTVYDTFSTCTIYEALVVQY